MSAWRRKAIELLPEQRDLIQTADNPMFLWTELGHAFNTATELEDLNFLKRLFLYADWCWKESRCDECINGALIGFYENIPSHKDQWWTVAAFVPAADFHGLKEVFKYFLNDRQFAEFSEYYLRERAQKERTALRERKVATRKA